MEGRPVRDGLRTWSLHSDRVSFTLLERLTSQRTPVPTSLLPQSGRLKNPSSFIILICDQRVPQVSEFWRASTLHGVSVGVQYFGKTLTDYILLQVFGLTISGTRSSRGISNGPTSEQKSTPSTSVPPVIERVPESDVHRSRVEFFRTKDPVYECRTCTQSFPL